jgi:hypothetical protein
MSTVQVTKERIRASAKQAIGQRAFDSLVAARFSSPKADGGYARARLDKALRAERNEPGSPATSRLSSARHEEWTILRTSSVNGLMIGAPQLTEAAVAMIDKGKRRPVVWWAADQALELPELTSGTLVIRDVDRLDARQQEGLARWIRAHCPRVQVLALAGAPLFAQVEDGRFSAALYYCLNVVVVEVRELADLP